MIIGVIGKISSGKDTVGKIIQYLTSEADEKWTFEEYLEKYPYLGSFGVGYLPEWEIHKFADPLKEIVCILTGCKRSDLEDIDFKNSHLSDEWTQYNRLQTFRGTYEERNNFVKSDSSIVMLDKDMPIIGTNRRIFWYTFTKRRTYREALQQIGTDLFRYQFHDDTWVNALMAHYETFDKWIVTDVRFTNEVKAVKDRYGLLIKVTRPSIVSDSIHPSETMVDSLEADYEIINDGSLNDLINKVREILVKEKIIS